MNKEIFEVGTLRMDLYRCISEGIDTDKVVLTSKSLIHMMEHHPEVFNEILEELKRTISCPDYIIKDDSHPDSGLVIKEMRSEKGYHSFIVLRVCTDSKKGELANSIISGWKITDKRLKSYLRNKTVLYRKE